MVIIFFACTKECMLQLRFSGQKVEGPWVFLLAKGDRATSAHVKKRLNAHACSIMSKRLGVNECVCGNKRSSLKGEANWRNITGLIDPIQYITHSCHHETSLNYSNIKHPGKMSSINTWEIQLISSCAYRIKIASLQGLPFENYCPHKSSYKNYLPDFIGMKTKIYTTLFSLHFCWWCFSIFSSSFFSFLF